MMPLGEEVKKPWENASNFPRNSCERGFPMSI